jgi:hypothetical protein
MRYSSTINVRANLSKKKEWQTIDEGATENFMKHISIFKICVK